MHRMGFIRLQMLRGGVPLFILLALLFLALFQVGGTAAAQDGEFSPRRDVTPIGIEKKATPVSDEPVVEYSFFRYDGAFRSLCQKLEVDGRATRFITVAERSLQDPATSQGLKTFWRSVVSGCRPPHKPSPKDSATDSEQGAQGGGEVPRPGQRTPSIEVIEEASALSNQMYQDEPGLEPNLVALQAALERLLSTPDLTRSEREYYSVLEEYLLAAWKGREGVVGTPERE